MRLLTGLIMAILLIATAATAHDYKLGALRIGHPWARATPPGATTGGGFLTVTNTGTEPDRLVGVASPAGNVEIHLMAMSDGVMTMRPVADGLEIPAGGTVELKPGGFHLMVMGLTAPFAEGHRVPVTLTFEKAGDIAVELAVTAIGAPGPMDGGMMHQHQ